jgi:hypothetical protein
MDLKNDYIEPINLENYDELLKTFKNSSFIPVSRWNSNLKNAENLYLIGQSKFAVIKCNEIFFSIISKLSRSLKINLSDFNNFEELKDKLKLINVSISNYIGEIIDHKYYKIKYDPIELNVEKYISVLKMILISIKSKKRSRPSRKENELKSEKSAEESKIVSKFEADSIIRDTSWYWSKLIEIINRYENSDY